MGQHCVGERRGQSGCTETNGSDPGVGPGSAPGPTKRIAFRLNSADRARPPRTHIATPRGPRAPDRSVPETGEPPPLFGLTAFKEMLPFRTPE
ncbi:hypothetical protein HPB48_007660 [Haemaphysalis longicornis]|uniref:Uncharacterized protein n=1 Tax=Haemaphysalis longicornis TaxID=44386 RepID=A0A9J6G334_HAELO|nr:hypothetical protein HPB48_007660 [Haemaphysalis longicornis]